jgi:hypothetical protein
VAARLEAHGHVLDAVDEIRLQPAGLAVGADARHPLGQRLQQDAQLQCGEMAAEAEVRAAVAEAGVRVGARPTSN